MIFSANRIVFTGLELRALLAYSQGAAPAFDGVCVDVDGFCAWSGDGTKSLTCFAITRPTFVRRLSPLRIQRESVKAAAHFDAASFAWIPKSEKRQLLWRGFMGDDAKALAVRPDAAKSIASGIADCEIAAVPLFGEERELVSSCTIDPRALQPIGVMRTLGIREVRVYMHGEGCPLSAIGEVDGHRWIAECCAPTRAAKRTKR